MIPKSEVFNIDCMEALRQTPDKFYKLAIVDPEYGIGEHGGKCRGNPKRPSYELRKKVAKYEKKDWDNERPSPEYFKELFRVSVNQIIWGANYFTDYLPPSMGWIFWDKMFEKQVFSDGEFAYTSFKRAAKQFTMSSKAETQGGLLRIHPTQKPVALYEWLLKNYAQKGDNILDTHMGSQSSRIAAYKLGFDFTGYEIDADYFKEGNERFKDAVSMPLFDKPVYVPQQLVLV